MSFSLNRRDFLKTGVGVGAVASLFPFETLGGYLEWFGIRAVEEDHLFVQLQIEGGADTVQSIDPLRMPEQGTEDDLWRGFGDDAIKKIGEIELGPAAYALERHANDIAVVRGIWMGLGGGSSHEHCRVYMASGFAGSRYRSRIVPAEIASRTQMGLAGVVLNTTREWWVDPKNVPSSITSDLQKSNFSSLDQGAVLGALDSPLGLKNLLPSRLKFASSKAILLPFVSAVNEMKNQNGGEISDEQVFALALAKGIARQGHFNLGGDYNGPGPGLDTHGSTHEYHLERQTWHWDKVAEIFDLFKNTEYKSTGDSLFSKTTFLVTNEFSRPPFMNSAGGKDHNPDTNAAILAGKGVKGGVSIGGSELFLGEEKWFGSSNLSWLVGAPVDFQTGVPMTREAVADWKNMDDGWLIRPENVIATVAEIMGVPRASYSPIGDPTVQLLPRVRL